MDRRAGSQETATFIIDGKAVLLEFRVISDFDGLQGWLFEPSQREGDARYSWMKEMEPMRENY